MTYYEINYIKKGSSEMLNKNFSDISDALSFIKKEEKKISYYTLWENTVKIIKTK